MKKVRAMKILCAVLTVMMVLGTGLSAMAVSSTWSIKYNTEGGYTITTNVYGLDANGEMVTYLVHDAASMYTITPDDIDYIDQKTSTGSTETFTYSSTEDWNENNKIYVGAESLSSGPVEATEKTAPTVTVDGAVEEVTIENMDADIKKIALDEGVTVTEVKLNGTAIDFFVIGDSIAFDADVSVDDTIAITTGTNDNLTGDVAVKLGTYGFNEDKDTFVAFGRAKGDYTICGIGIINIDTGDEIGVFDALGVSGVNGGFAIELVDEDGTNLEEAFAGYTVYAYADEAWSVSTETL